MLIKNTIWVFIRFLSQILYYYAYINFDFLFLPQLPVSPHHHTKKTQTATSLMPSLTARARLKLTTISTGTNFTISTTTNTSINTSSQKLTTKLRPPHSGRCLVSSKPLQICSQSRNLRFGLALFSYRDFFSVKYINT